MAAPAMTASGSDSLASGGAINELTALQVKLSVLSELSRELQTVRSFTRTLLQPHSNESRKTLGSLDAFSATVLSPETQKALNAALARERQDSSEVDEYQRLLTKPIAAPPR